MLLVANFSQAQANDYPNRPIKLLVGIGAGSTTDLLARVAARHLSDALKQPVVVENRPGAGGTLGAAAVAAAPADGYTLLYATSSLPSFVHFYDGLRFDPAKDLIGVAGMAQGGMVMLTRTDAPWSNLTELIAYAKSKPANTVSYASSGIGSIAYLYSELFAHSVGVHFLHVPYKSSAAALGDLMAGQVDFVFDGTTTAQPQIASGRVRGLAFSSNEGSRFLPGVPSMSQAGVENFSQRTWMGIVAPRQTPVAVLQHLSQASASFVDQPQYRNELAAAAHEPLSLSSAGFEQLIQDDSRQLAQSLKTILGPSPKP